ncbi:GAF domain protein [Enhygromyxa salina]|uniref:GAF domain protein n=1 Tax=Enhygromyxa salina TaxID=215803 RepID=A0A2S9YAP1_9BACT|nr:GAF domain-containing protein [Enhygromyxa salina]PRQ02169.1 GAF domain protein [Enhygromyxa salina]
MSVHEHEDERLAALREYAILDAEPEARFDDVAKLAGAALDMPIAQVSLVDEYRQWPLASVGVERDEIRRQHAFCSWAILDDELLVIDDPTADARFKASPLVTGPTHARFYAGAPLIASSGHRLGTVCVIDREPRTLSPRQAEILRTLARQVVDLLDLRLASRQLDGALVSIRAMATLIPICSHCRKVRDDENRWSTLERLVQAKTGSRFTHGICPDCVREHYPDAAEDLLRQGR